MWLLRKILDALGLSSGSLSYTQTLGSGVIVTDEERDEDNRKAYMDEKPQRLRRICESVVKDPKLLGIGDKTYCNVAVYRICRQFANDNDFDGLLANEIFDLCAKSPRWAKVEGKWAAEYAMSGGLTIAAQKGKPHGHVAVVLPAPMVKSPSWGKDVPLLANVGKTNGIMAASKAFKDEPSYFVRKQDKEA